MDLDWAEFIAELEERKDREAVVHFDFRGAFLKFRSQLVSVERPGSFSVETMTRFGVVPYFVTLAFANGVRVNVYLRHIDAVIRRGDGLYVSFKAEEDTRTNSIAFDAEERHEGRAG